MTWMAPRLSRTLARWLVGAMLLAALGPAVSRSLTALQQPGDWVEICTSQGMRWVQLGERETGRLADTSLALDRCGLCSLASERFAPLLPGMPEVAASALSWGVPAHTLVASRAAPIPSPTARGPPHWN